MKGSIHTKVAGLFLACCFLLHHTPIRAQSPKTTYERLLETQREYDQAITRGDTAEIAELCYLLGKRYIGLANYPKAQQWLLRSLSMRKHLGLSEPIGKIHLRMCEIQAQLGNAAKTMYHARLAVKNFEAAGKPEELSSAYRSLGGAFQLRAQVNPAKAAGDQLLDIAIVYHQKALHLDQQLKNEYNEALSWYGLGLAWKKRDIRKSELYIVKALNIYHKLNQSALIVELSLQLAEDFLEQNKPATARKWLDDATLFAKNKNTSPGLKTKLQKTLAEYYRQKGDWKKAFLHERTAAVMNDTLFKNYRVEGLQNIEVAFEGERKTSQLQAQRKELELHKKNLEIKNALNIIAGILLLLAVVSATAFYILFKRYKALSYQNALLVKEQNHRTKNNLQSILDLLNLYTHKLEHPEAKVALEESLLRVEAISLVHYKLYNTDDLIHVELATYIPDLITSILRNYRMHKIPIDFHLEDIRLHVDKAITLGLILNELTTNACKYALKNNPNPMLRVSCSIEDEKMHFIFADNGPGLNWEESRSTFGMGLINILLSKLKASGQFVTEYKGCCFELTFAYDKMALLVDHI